MPIDTITLPGNSHGSDFVMKNWLCRAVNPVQSFKKRVKQLKLGDRLFIDEDIFALKKGQTLQLINFINTYNTKKGVQIYVTRGSAAIEEHRDRYRNQLAKLGRQLTEKPVITADTLKSMFFSEAKDSDTQVESLQDLISKRENFISGYNISSNLATILERVLEGYTTDRLAAVMDDLFIKFAKKNKDPKSAKLELNLYRKYYSYLNDILKDEAYYEKKWVFKVSEPESKKLFTFSESCPCSFVIQTVINAHSEVIPEFQAVQDVDRQDGFVSIVEALQPEDDSVDSIVSSDEAPLVSTLKVSSKSVEDFDEKDDSVISTISTDSSEKAAPLVSILKRPEEVPLVSTLKKSSVPRSVLFALPDYVSDYVPEQEKDYPELMQLDFRPKLTVDEINEKIHSRVCAQFGKTRSLSTHKAYYNKLLAANVDKLEPTQRIALAHYLLDPARKHFLTEERHKSGCFFTRNTHSNETRSMQTAIKCLLEGLDSGKHLTVEGLFTHKLTITAQDTATDQVPIILNRFGH